MSFNTGVINNITDKLTGVKSGEKPQHFNIVLPQLKTEGATVNVVVNDKNLDKLPSEIVIPGHGGSKKTVINVPGWDDKEMPDRKSKLTIDVSANVSIET